MRIGVVHHAPHGGARLDEFMHGRGEVQRLVVEDAQPPVGVGAEPDPLRGGAAIADEREHLTTRQHDPYRALQHGRGHHGGDLVRPHALGPEGAADVLGAHPYRRRIQREQARQLLRHPHAALVGVDDLKAAAFPARGGRMRLHRAVMLLGRGVFRVHDDGGGGETGLEIALLRRQAGRVLRRVRTGAPGEERDIVRILVVVHHQRLGGLTGLLGRLGDHQRHRPADARHAVVLEDRHGRVGLPQQSHVVAVDARGVPVVQHGEDAGHLLYGGGLHGADTAPGDGGQHQPAVGEFGVGDLAGVAGRAGDLRQALHTGVRRADGPGDRGGFGRQRGHRGVPLVGAVGWVGRAGSAGSAG